MIELTLENGIIIIGITLITIICISLDYIMTHILPIRYKLDDNGYVMFYYPYYSCWKYVKIWDDTVKERNMDIYDRIHDSTYNITYVGPGVNYIKIECDKPSNYKSSDIRKQLSYIRNSQELWNQYCNITDKENSLVRKISKEKIL